MTYEVLWDGSHKGCNADLLCVGNPPTLRETLYRELPVLRRSRHEERAELLKLLAQRPIWRIADLGDRVGLVGSMLHGLITRLKNDGLIVSVSYGKVSLRTRQETAA